MELTITTVMMFIIALIISAVIIFVITKIFGETEDIKTAFLAAFIGTAIYTIIYFILGQGLIAAFIGGIVWLIALQKLYEIGWIKSLVIAVLIWIVTSIVGWFLPVLTGPV